MINFEEIRETLEERRQELTGNKELTNEFLIDDLVLDLGYNKKRDKHVKRITKGTYDWEIEVCNAKIAISVFSVGDDIAEDKIQPIIDRAEKDKFDVLIVTNGEIIQVIRIINDSGYKLVKTISILDNPDEQTEIIINALSKQGFSLEKLDELIVDISIEPEEVKAYFLSQFNNFVSLLSAFITAERPRCSNAEEQCTLFLQSLIDKYNSETSIEEAIAAETEKFETARDSYLARIEALSTSLNEKDGEISRLNETIAELQANLDRYSGKNTSEAEQMLDMLDPHNSSERSYAAIINNDIIQNKELHKFIGLVLSKLYQLKSFDAQSFIFNGSIFRLKHENPVYNDLIINNKPYDILISSDEEDDALIKLRSIFSHFTDITFVCKKFGYKASEHNTGIDDSDVSGQDEYISEDKPMDVVDDSHTYHHESDTLAKQVEASETNVDETSTTVEKMTETPTTVEKTPETPETVEESSETTEQPVGVVLESIDEETEQGATDSKPGDFFSNANDRELTDEEMEQAGLTELGEPDETGSISIDLDDSTEYDEDDDDGDFGSSSSDSDDGTEDDLDISISENDGNGTIEIIDSTEDLGNSEISSVSFTPMDEDDIATVDESGSIIEPEIDDSVKEEIARNGFAVLDNGAIVVDESTVPKSEDSKIEAIDVEFTPADDTHIPDITSDTKESSQAVESESQALDSDADTSTAEEKKEKIKRIMFGKNNHTDDTDDVSSMLDSIEVAPVAPGNEVETLEPFEAQAVDEQLAASGMSEGHEAWSLNPMDINDAQGEESDTQVMFVAPEASDSGTQEVEAELQYEENDDAEGRVYNAASNVEPEASGDSSNTTDSSENQESEDDESIDFGFGTPSIESEPLEGFDDPEDDLDEAPVSNRQLLVAQLLNVDKLIWSSEDCKFNTIKYLGNNNVTYAINPDCGDISCAELLCRCIDAVMATQEYLGDNKTVIQLKKKTLSTADNFIKKSAPEYSHYPKINGTDYRIVGVQTIQEAVTVLSDICTEMNIDTTEMFIYFDAYTESQYIIENYGFSEDQVQIRETEMYAEDESHEFNSSIAVIKGDIFNNIIVTKNSLEVQKQVVTQILAVRTNYISRVFTDNLTGDFLAVVEAALVNASEQGLKINLVKLGRVIGENFRLISENSSEVGPNPHELNIAGHTIYCADVKPWQIITSLIRLHNVIFNNSSIALKIRINADAVNYYATEYDTGEPATSLAIRSYINYIAGCVKPI